MQYGEKSITMHVGIGPLYIAVITILLLVLSSVILAG